MDHAERLTQMPSVVPDPDVEAGLLQSHDAKLVDHRDPQALGATIICVDESQETERTTPPARQRGRKLVPWLMDATKRPEQSLNFRSVEEPFRARVQPHKLLSIALRSLRWDR